MLSYDGGPNHAGNLCDSPIIANQVLSLYLYCGYIMFLLVIHGVVIQLVRKITLILSKFVFLCESVN